MLRQLADVIGIERNLAAPSRSIDDVLGNGIAAGEPPHAGNEAKPILNAGAKMPRTGGKVALIEVIGAHPTLQQPVAELHLRGNIVIHPPQKHTLAPQGQAVIRQQPQSPGGVLRELPRMIAVDGKKQRGMPTQHGTKLRRDAPGQHDGHARTHPKELNVGNPAEF